MNSYLFYLALTIALLIFAMRNVFNQLTINNIDQKYIIFVKTDFQTIQMNNFCFLKFPHLCTFLYFKQLKLL